MLSIHLKDLVFFKHHGVYQEEKILGNHFIVNVHVHYLPPAPVVEKLEDAVNYEKIFDLVNARMMKPTPLLETLAMEICTGILDTFEPVEASFVSIEKTNPPIHSLEGSVVVSYQLSRKHH